MGDSQVDPSVVKIFGDVKRDLIDKEWTRRRYIEMTKVQDCDPDNPQFEYRWGERATIEFEKKDILKFVAKVIFSASSPILSLKIITKNHFISDL